MSAVDTAQLAFWEGHLGAHMKVVRSGEKMTMIYSRIEPGSEIPEHKHPQEQIAYCLQGEATFKIGDKTFLIKKGYSFLIPANIVHSGKITGDEEYICLESFSPPRTDLLRGEFKPEKAQ